MKKVGLWVLALIGCAVIYWASGALSALNTDKVLTQLFDMGAPTRYVFIADDELPRIAVVDLLTNQQVNTLKTQVVADFIALVPLSTQLLYAHEGGRKLYAYNVQTHEEQSLELDFVIQAIVTNASETQVWLVGEDVVQAVDSEHLQAQEKIVGLGDGRRLHYFALGRALWAVDEKRAKVHSYDLTVQELHDFDLPSQWQDYSLSALSPNGEWLVFAIRDGHDGQWQLVLWDTSQRQILKTYPLQAQSIQPFVDSNSYRVVAADEQGGLLSISSDALENPVRWQSEINPRRLTLGWLDSQLLIGGEQALASYDLDDLSESRVQSLQGAMRDVFVSADSKSGLFVQEGINALFIFDFKNKQMQSIELDNMQSPAKVIMGIGSTLCH